VRRRFSERQKLWSCTRNEGCKTIKQAHEAVTDVGRAEGSPLQASVADGTSRRQRRGIPSTRVMLTAMGEAPGWLSAWHMHCGSSCTMLPRLVQHVSDGAATLPSTKGRQGTRRTRSVAQLDSGTGRTPPRVEASSSSTTQNKTGEAISSANFFLIGFSGGLDALTGTGF
jgi:hypothetical protein